MLRVTLMVGILGLSAWGCLAIIGAHYGLRLPILHYYIHVATWTAGPLVLLAASVFAWLRVRTWRRMEIMRDLPPGGISGKLARGAHSADAPRTGPGSLEGLTMKLVLLALITFPY